MMAIKGTAARAAMLRTGNSFWIPSLIATAVQRHAHWWPFG